MDNNTLPNLDDYMQSQPTVTDDIALQQQLQQQQQAQLKNAQPDNQSPQNNNDGNNVYQTLYQWGIENNIFDVDINQLQQYDPTFNINSEEGFRRLMEVQSEIIAEDILRNKFKGWNDKTIEDFVEAINNGANISDFAQAYGDRDWETLDLRNIVNQKLVIRKDLEMQGRSMNYINDYITMLENSNKLKEYAVEHQNSLSSYQDQRQEQYMEQLRAQRDLEAKQLELYEQTFINNLTYKDEIAGLPIEDTEKQNLYDFVFESKPLYWADGNPYVDETGNQVYGTDYQTMMEQLDDQQQIELHMLIGRYLLNGMKLGGIEQMYNQQVGTLEDKLRNVNITNQNKNPQSNGMDALAQHVFSGK
jgi:hypothetical protein